jgi:4-amino-4-deoxy-L-arabinose transferase-like glycosyltransferase
MTGFYWHTSSLRKAMANVTAVPSARRERWSGRFLVAIALLALLLSTYSSLRNRPFESPDELEHYQFVRYLLDQRALPVLDPQGPLSQYHQPPLYYLGGALFVAGVDDDGQLPERNPQWLSYRPGEVHRDNKAQFLPLPAFRFPYAGTARVLHLLRFWSILISAGTLFVMWRLVRDIWPDRPARRLLAFALFAFNPMLLYIAGSANNDNLVTLLGALMLWLSLRALERGFPWLNTVAIGLVWGLAMLTKLNGLLLLVPWSAALLVASWDRRDWQLFLSRALAIMVLALGLAGWWFVRNELLYGELFALETMLDIWGKRLDRGPSALFEAIVYAWQSLWGRFGYGQIVLPGPFNWGFTALALLAGAGGLLSLRRPGWRDTLSGRWLVMVMTVAGYAAALFYFIVRNPTGANGRYLFPAFPALAILLAAGLAAVPAARWFRHATLLFLSVTAVFALAWLVPWTYGAPRQIALAEARSQLVSPLDVRWPDGMQLLGTSAEVQEAEVAILGCWHAEQTPSRDYIFFIHLVGHDLAPLGRRDTHTGLANYPTSLWAAGDTFCERYRVPLQRSGLEAPEVARVVVGFYDPQTVEQLPAQGPPGQPLDFIVASEVRVAPAEPAPLPTPPRQVEAGFEQGVTLTGYDWSPAAVTPGEPVTLTVWWHAEGSLSDNYTVFAHLLGPDGDLLGQADHQPREGRYPTTYWQRDETIVDTHTFVIPAGTPAGETQVLLGFYRLADNQRLLRPAGAEIPDAVALPGPVISR